MTATWLDASYKKLIATRQQIQEEIAAGQLLLLQVADSTEKEDDADVTRDGVEHEATVLSHRLARMLTEVEVALISHDDGSYGVCKACHKTIPFERLNMWPQATLCITCKGRTESYVDDTCASNSSASG